MSCVGEVGCRASGCRVFACVCVNWGRALLMGCCDGGITDGAEGDDAYGKDANWTGSGSEWLGLE